MIRSPPGAVDSWSGWQWACRFIRSAIPSLSSDGRPTNHADTVPPITTGPHVQGQVNHVAGPQRLESLSDSQTPGQNKTHNDESVTSPGFLVGPSVERQQDRIVLINGAKTVSGDRERAMTEPAERRDIEFGLTFRSRQRGKAGTSFDTGRR